MVVGFEQREEAEAFLQDVRRRFNDFGLQLHSEKTRLLEFGRSAVARRKGAGEGKPETFNFLGFTHICSQTRTGRFTIRRKTIAKRRRAKLRAIKTELRRRMHAPVPETGRWLRSVLQGYYHYFAVPYNLDALNQLRYEVGRAWRHMLRRRSQKPGNISPGRNLNAFRRSGCQHRDCTTLGPTCVFAAFTQGRSRVR
jgi:hypothetical protein